MSVQAFPDLRLNLLNGWLPLAFYFAGLMLAVASLPGEARARLFADPKQRMPPAARVARLLGQAAMLIYIGLMIFTPLTLDAILFAIGVLVYALGYGCVLAALRCFEGAPIDQAIVSGPYRLSRNPQWLGLVLVLVGAALMASAWLCLGIVVVVAVIYHQQILAEEQACLEQYGESFRAYMAAVPRYFWFL